MPNVWVAVPPGGDSSRLVRNDLTKAAGDTITAEMDFGDFAELWAGAVAQSCTVSAPAGLTVVSPGTVNSGGYAVSSKITGGVAGTDYGVTFTATLSDAGATVIARTGVLKVV